MSYKKYERKDVLVFVSPTEKIILDKSKSSEHELSKKDRLIAQLTKTNKEQKQEIFDLRYKLDQLIEFMGSSEAEPLIELLTRINATK